MIKGIGDETEETWGGGHFLAPGASCGADVLSFQWSQKAVENLT